MNPGKIGYFRYIEHVESDKYYRIAVQMKINQIRKTDYFIKNKIVLGKYLKKKGTSNAIFKLSFLLWIMLCNLGLVIRKFCAAFVFPF